MAEDRKTLVSGWGMVQRADCAVHRPEDVDGIRAAFDDAKRTGRKIGLRGGGNSYGDASLNADEILLDLTGLRRILDWNPETGIIVAEPGVTIRDVWQHVIEDGWWPPVVSGTSFVTLGGAAAMNIHGKNNYCMGTIGRHIQAFDFMLTSGEILTCTREENEELFHAAIGGFGVLGCFVSITLRLKKIWSGWLEVEPLLANDFRETVEHFESRADDSDYLVGWHDAMVTGKRLGRGVLHRARYLDEGEDPDPAKTLNAKAQTLPSAVLGIYPKKYLWLGLWFFMNRPGQRLINAARWFSGKQHVRKGKTRWVHAEYHFLLDFVPDWKLALRPTGLIQFQSFVPRAHAARVFGRLIQLTHDHKLPPYLCVTKRHLPDPFLMTHGLDGYSQALEIRVTPRNKQRVWAMARGMEELVLDAGGRFYFAKDSVMNPETVLRSYPAENVARFLELKKELDPDRLLQTDLFRRLFPDEA